MKSTLKQSFRVNDSHIIFTQFGITVTEVDEGDTIEISGFDEDALRMGIYNYIVDLGVRIGDESATEWLEDILSRSASSLEKIEPNSGVITSINKIKRQGEK